MLRARVVWIVIAAVTIVFFSLYLVLVYQILKMVEVFLDFFL